jgi:hypothetical protein
MSKLVSTIIGLFSLQSLLQILVLWGIASIVPLILLMSSAPVEAQKTALMQVGVTFGVLFIFVSKYIRVNKPAKDG